METSSGAGYGDKSVKRQIHFQGPDVGKPLARFVDEAVAGGAWLVKFGAVYVDHLRVIDPDFEVGPENIIRVHLNPKRYNLKKEEIRKRIVAETDDYLVIDKPSGVPMHPTLDNIHENILAAFDFPVFITHRLDVPTSGLVLIAKTKEYQTLFNKIIYERRLKKIYEATVENAVPLGLHRHHMLVSERAPKVIVAEPPSLDASNKWDECLLQVMDCRRAGENFLVTLELLTGRTHQIRAQLAFLGAPVVGDVMYGYAGASSVPFGLRACALSFVCPKIKKPLSFQKLHGLEVSIK